MRKTALTAALAGILFLPQPAAALPRTTEALETQLAICEAGLKMVINGATDDEELEMYAREIAKHGWSDPKDLEDMLMLCIFFKQGYIHAGEN